MRFKAGIYKDAASDPEYPWFFNIEYVPRRDDPYGYGNVATFPEAIASVGQLMCDALGKDMEESQ
jgi:hypothetical protein